MKWICCTCLVFIAMLNFNSVVNAENCNKSESPISCHGVRIIRNVFHHIVHDKKDSPLKLMPGLEIVGEANLEVTDEQGRSNSIDDNDDSYVGRIAKYLQTHALNIKFVDLLDRADFKDVIKTALDAINESKGVVEGRQTKTKNNGNSMAMLALMFAKTIAALKIGAIGLLAAKALGIALIALLLAIIAAIKKLTEHHDDGGHHVQYVQAHSEHHRKRRDLTEDVLPLPYKGWTQYASL